MSGSRTPIQTNPGKRKQAQFSPKDAAMRLQLGNNWWRAVRGTGGMQGLMRVLKARASRGGIVELSERNDAGLIERWKRYTRAYGQGGFQRRLGKVE
jgi:hypothetical protein